MEHTETTGFESNEFIDRLPKHLKQFIKPQNYEDYTPINQAVWRYVMRKNADYLSKVAHESYMEGLEKTGVEIDKIPNLYGMNRILKEIGWAAVAVDGFIPPNAFMEFQAYKVLVIASDIRQLEHIEYTPSPDIIHESAGHAPIIANPDYAEYLRRLGAVGAKAILSKYDMDLYEAVRKLSILKEAEGISEAQIEEAEQEVAKLQEMEVQLSEMAEIRNLQWWTVEYGLVGSMEDPKIYGAGLLSSIGESKWCMSEEVKKIPYSLDAAKQKFNITKPQPQLYVTPDFAHLMEVLEEFSNTLSVRKGGSSGIQKLVDSRMVGTIELSSGLQVSGNFAKVITDANGEVIFYKTDGATCLATRDKELIGHGIKAHADGFSSPLGKLRNTTILLEDLNPTDFKKHFLSTNNHVVFEFESGIQVSGTYVTDIRNIYGKLIVIQLKDCTVTYGEQLLFMPEYGVFDMAVGNQITSAYAGAADCTSFPNVYGPSQTLTIKPEKTESSKQLEKLYGRVRELRNTHDINEAELVRIFETLQTNYSNEWLLCLEIYELATDEALLEKVYTHLQILKKKSTKIALLIHEGLALLPDKNLWNHLS
ncbi:phenylalanine-4-hydroxylase [Pustulibacterium marinum]|uniref:Phenylalanine-4-hydroxylase n=1 Tax=Pustulibacterium marinum TaxID=1224947 RepID=A0A1I7IA11_9FLAO|nr:aromatic amino acid hydroxylase [Pustulibacterium marinum]SFU69789.1 phenylalanine-4-hydroxylase [Pustulibacterium marinum]